MSNFALKTCNCRGFTLTELAIVLGVVGLLIGGIWAASANVYRNKKIMEAQREVLVIAQNMRKLYMGRGSLTCTSGTTDITAQMVTAGVFPANMLFTGVTYPQSPWGGNVQVFACSDAVTGDNTLFQIEYMPTMDSTQCSPLLAVTVGPGQDQNLQYVSTGASGWMSTTNGTAYDVTSFSNCTLAGFAFRL